ncbi:hypothetical protein DFH08DRAFT_820790 [Mycena albidolilacea]|uniref:Uncharacterized protein n=1 Tax=Mycena albidolilacea TaxID=1033008 RepID=A0AAD7EDR7_9AGAR|nr:hypothetical protein DFH08DRAFT_820790 [Mycena albidolilacea]
MIYGAGLANVEFVMELLASSGIGGHTDAHCAHRHGSANGDSPVPSPPGSSASPASTPPHQRLQDSATTALEYSGSSAAAGAGIRSFTAGAAVAGYDVLRASHMQMQAIDSDWGAAPAPGSRTSQNRESPTGITRRLNCELSSPHYFLGTRQPKHTGFVKPIVAANPIEASPVTARSPARTSPHHPLASQSSASFARSAPSAAALTPPTARHGEKRGGRDGRRRKDDSKTRDRTAQSRSLLQHSRWRWNVPYVQNAVLWSSIQRGIVLTRSQNDYLPWPRISFLGNALSIFLLFVEPVETLTRGGILCDIGPRAHLPSTRPAGSLSIPPGVVLRGAAYSSDFVFFVLRLECIEKERCQDAGASACTTNSCLSVAIRVGLLILWFADSRSSEDKA